jgi:hypothetical protein
VLIILGASVAVPLLLGVLSLVRQWRARAWGQDALAVGLIVLAVVGCFWRVFALPGYWVPEGGGDNASTLLPFYRFAIEELRGGRLPLWNPYLYTGAPFAANLQAAVFYPVTWLLAAPPSSSPSSC